jgi:hypothetical protein
LVSQKVNIYHVGKLNFIGVQFSSPTEPTSPEAVPKSLWTKEGRVSSPSDETGASDPLAHALGFPQKATIFNIGKSEITIFSGPIRYL